MKNKGKKRSGRLNGFIVFSREYRQKLLADNPTLAFGAVSRIVGKKWREFGIKERKNYQEQAELIEEEERLKKSPSTEPEIEDIPTEIIDLVDDDENMVARKSLRVKKSPVVYQSAETSSKTPKSHKTVSKATTFRRSYRQDVDLHMECFEEELSSAQLAAIKLAQEEHEKANDFIKEFRAGRILVPSSQPNTFTLAASKSSQQAPQTQVVKVSNNNTGVSEQQNTGSFPPPRPAQFLHKQQHEINKSRGSVAQPDVILISDSQPIQKLTSPSTSSVHVQNIATLNVQPSSVTPQQVYKFVNVPNSVSQNFVQNQWTLRPVLKVSPHQQSNQTSVVPHSTLINQGQAVNVQPSTNLTSLKSSVVTVSGQKRPPQTESSSSPTPLKKKATKVGDVLSDNWIPLDEYYYGTHDGDVSYTEEKGEYRFKCWYCSKMLYNNVRAMQHIQGHIDASKQQNIDLSDLTQCKHCYKQFDTPFDMQTHVEKVHLSNKVLMCRICEKDFPSQKDLMIHMKSNHHICEMPYVCQLCHFRSSMYSDVVDHFKKKHDSSHYLLCLYCLRSFEVKFVSQGWGQTQTYYGHLLKHQAKSSTKKCAVCRLTFFNSVDVKSHRKNCHDSNPMHVQALAEGGKSGAGIQQKKGSSLKSLNAPSISRIQDYGEIIFPAATNNLKCVECKMIMSSTDHYKKYVHCTMCRFATSCSVAYANHMMGFHSGQMSSLNLNIPWERPMKEAMYCDCNFSSKYGNKMANHLVYCGKRTCYSTKPTSAVTSVSIKSPVEDKQIEEESLLDMLGLVQKKTVVPKSNMPEIHDCVKKEADMLDVQKFDVKDERHDVQDEAKVNDTNQNNIVKDLMEDNATESESAVVDKSLDKGDNPTKDEPKSLISTIQTDKPLEDHGIAMDDIAEKVNEATKTFPMSEKVDIEPEDKEVIAGDDVISEREVTSANVSTGDKSDCVVLKADSTAEISMGDKNDGNTTDISGTNLCDDKQETLEESGDVDKDVSENEMDTVQTLLEKKYINAETDKNEMATAANLETDGKEITSTADLDTEGDELNEDTKSVANLDENKMDIDNEKDVQDHDEKAEDSNADKEDFDIPNEDDSMKEADEETSDQTADSVENKKLEDESSTEKMPGESVNEGKDLEQDTKSETSHDGEASDHHSNTHDDKPHRGHHSQGSSHRSDQNQGRDRSYDRDRNRDRSYDRDRDRSYDRDWDRRRDRDYNRSSGYSGYDSRGYRGHQGQRGSYHSNRDYQDRNRGGHYQDRSYNRNYQNRGSGYNQNYRGGYRDRY